MTRGSDPFGSTVGERLWRRLAGVAAAVVPATAGFVLWTTEVLPWVLLGALVVHVLGVPASWLLTRRGGAPVVRHALAAVVIAVLVAGVLSLPTDAPLGWWVLFASIAVTTGVPIAVLAAWAGSAPPGPLGAAHRAPRPRRRVPRSPPAVWRFTPGMAG